MKYIIINNRFPIMGSSDDTFHAPLERVSGGRATGAGHFKIVDGKVEEALKAIELSEDTIHCYMGFIGADWEKKSVIELIKKSKRIAWAYNVFKHNLAVINDGKLFLFELTPTELKS